MAATFPANVDIVYADEDQGMRRGLTDSIKENGYHGVREVGSLGDELLRAVGAAWFLRDELLPTLNEGVDKRGLFEIPRWPQVGPRPQN